MREKERKKRGRDPIAKEKGGGRLTLRKDGNGGGWLQDAGGWETKLPGELGGNPRVWGLGGLGPVFGLLSRSLKIFLFCKIKFGN